MNETPNQAAGGNAGERRSSARSNRGVWAALPGMPQLGLACPASQMNPFKCTLSFNDLLF
jgi:hypothetical protein